jgi:hypothetical protein
MLPRLESMAIMRRMPKGCTPEPAGASVPRMMRSILEFAGGVQGQQGGALVAVVDDL